MIENFSTRGTTLFIPIYVNRPSICGAHFAFRRTSREHRARNAIATVDIIELSFNLHRGRVIMIIFVDVLSTAGRPATAH